MSQHEKYREVFPTCKYIAQLTAEETGKRYQGRVRVLLALSKAWEQGRDIEVVEVLHQEATSPSSLEQGQCPLEEEDAGSPKAASDEAEQDYEIFERAEDQQQSDDGQLPQASSDKAGTKQLGTMAENRESQSAHGAGACGTLEQMEEVQLPQDILPSTSSTEPSDNVLQRLGKLKVPTKVKPRGRPKGAEKTVIGLPRRRQGLQKPATKLRPFRDLPSKEKELRILRCLIPQGPQKEVQQGKILLGEL